MMSIAFSVLVTGPPTTTQAHFSALRFIQAAVQAGHKINSVFFYQDAIQVANQLICQPSDETQLTQIWATKAKEFNFELQVCVAASNRRGVISAEEAAQNGLTVHNLHPDYLVLGLGQLAATISQSNSKLIQFK